MKIKTNITTNDCIKMAASFTIWGVMLAVIFLGFLDYYLNPVLEGFILMTDYFEARYGEDANYFLEIAQLDFDKLNDEFKEKISMENWETMTEGEGLNKMYGIIDQATDEVKERLWAVILFFVAPLLVAPLVLWIMIRIGNYCAEKTIQVLKLEVNYKNLRIWRE